MLNIIWEVAQTILPFAIKRFENNKQIKELKSEIEKLRKSAIIFCCFGFIIGLIIGYFMSKVMS